MGRNLRLILMGGAQRIPEERDIRFAKLWIARNRDRPDGDVASTYTISAVTLYRQLAEDGFPACPECGVFHLDEEHRQEHASRERKARGR